MDDRLVIFEATLTEFARLCDADPNLRQDYVVARRAWLEARTEADREAADEAYASVLARAVEARGSGYTEDEVRALITLRNRRTRERES